jgi:hypothetical protein
MATDVTRHEFDRLVDRVGKHDETLHGNGKMGVVTICTILWHTYVWLIAALSAGAGSLLTFVLMKLLGGG